MAPHRVPARAGQLELPFARHRTPDRNAERGGRSFYLFDFDDNLVHVDTRIFLFDRDTGAELPLSTRRFSEVSALVGKPGPFARYVVRDDDDTGSFRRFRDHEGLAAGEHQPFVQDLLTTLARPDHLWKGPSWPFFEHAVFNGRPVALITARGHDVAVIDEGVDLLCRAGHLHARPRWLGVYNVSNRRVREQIGDTELTRSVAERKRLALFDAVDRAMREHGENPHHRFGVSDDDATNLAVMVGAFVELKRKYPENAFFVIDASRRPVVKTEILHESTRTQEVPEAEQLGLFD